MRPKTEAEPVIKKAPYKQAELAAICHWVKQITGVVTGTCFGVIAFTGIEAFISFLSIAMFATFITYTKVLGADLEALGTEGQMELVKAGFVQAVGCFLAAWIIAYSVVYP